MVRKRIVLPVLGLMLAVVTVVSVNQVHAQADNTNFYSGLAQLVAQKFGLDQSKVQEVVNQYHDQQKQKMQENLQQREQDRLDKLVQDNKITAAQKQAILDELTVLKNKYNRSNFKGMTAEQRKQQFQAEQDEIKAWAQGQGIDPSYLMPGFGRGGKGMFGPGWANKDQPSPTPTQ